MPAQKSPDQYRGTTSLRPSNLHRKGQRAEQSVGHVFITRFQLRLLEGEGEPFFLAFFLAFFS